MKEKSPLAFVGLILTALIFILTVALAVTGFAAAGSVSDSEGLASVERSVRRAAVECYSLEGAYPPDISYLEEHYGVSYNTGRYLVHYRLIADNIMPEISVFALEAEQ